MKRLVVYDIYQDVQTSTGTKSVVILTIPAVGTEDHELALLEDRLAPRLAEYRKFGKVTVVRKIEEEILL